MFWLDGVLIFFLVLSAPLFIFLSIEYAWIFPVIPLVWVFRWILRRELFKRNVIDWAISLLVVQVSISCFVVPDIALSLPKVTGVLFGILFFFGMTIVLQSQKLIKLGIFAFAGDRFFLIVVWILVIFTTSQSLYKSLVGNIVEKLPKMNLRLPGAEAEFNPNDLAWVVVLFVPLLLVLTANFFDEFCIIFLSS